jgi:hypothetical protein
VILLIHVCKQHLNTAAGEGGGGSRRSIGGIFFSF